MGTSGVIAVAPTDLDRILEDFGTVVRDFRVRVGVLDEQAYAPDVAALLRMPWGSAPAQLELRPDTAGQVSVGFLRRLLPRLRRALTEPEHTPHVVGADGRPVVLFVHRPRFG